MCITKESLKDKLADYRSLKALKEETENALKALEYDIIEFLQETKECEATDKNGNSIRLYIGHDFKTTYVEKERETVDKAAVKELLGEEDFEKVRKVSRFGVLRVK